MVNSQSKRSLRNAQREGARIRSSDTFAVVVAGGKGTRFWPSSRMKRPKQFLPVLSGKTLLQETVQRIESVVPLERTFFVVARSHVPEILREIPSLKPTNVLAEPKGKNTAPAIGLAALEISRIDPEAVMIVLPADHAIADTKRFSQVLRIALCLVREENRLVTIGIRPTHPETGYGYIKRGALVSSKGSIRVYEADSFREKPPFETARAFLRSKKYLWNSGIFVWRAKAILEKIRTWQPEIFSRLQGIPNLHSARALRTAYASLPSISIDKGVLERERGLRVVEADFAWSDVGNWRALGDLWESGFVRGPVGELVAIESNHVVAYTPRKLLALLGVENLIIVDSRDAILVADRSRAQDVGKIVSELERRGGKKYL